MASLAPEHLRRSAFGLPATRLAAGNLIASAVSGLLWSAVVPWRRSRSWPPRWSSRRRSHQDRARFRTGGQVIPGLFLGWFRG
jgi:hypothetical protein